MFVAAVSQIFRAKQGGIVHKPHVVEELRKTRIAIVDQRIAENLNTVIYNDMHILISVKAVGFFIEIGTVAKEIRRIMPDFHISDKPLEITDIAIIANFIVMLYEHLRLFFSSVSS